MPNKMNISTKEIESILGKFKENEEWFDEHREELQKKYEDSVLAIKDRKVIKAGKKLDNLLQELEREGENPATVYIATILPKGTAFIL